MACRRFKLVIYKLHVDDVCRAVLPIFDFTKSVTYTQVKKNYVIIPIVKNRHHKLAFSNLHRYPVSILLFT